MECRFSWNSEGHEGGEKNDVNFSLCSEVWKSAMAKRANFLSNLQGISLGKALATDFHTVVKAGKGSTLRNCRGPLG
ncbi:uncharacterized protein LOC107274754 isoform X3 [Cephus cinctus]|uniref:Uncharacterized protein LOC107274754 isoform X3 n=1 Tax=Cephus cinctus TaxID=211228 RepID=A0AAJ7RV76_CEPCN|nr:uncharacterized protein LOC107274754 isoform X3 [Cephus cinctus]